MWDGTKGISNASKWSHTIYWYTYSHCHLIDKRTKNEGGILRGYTYQSILWTNINLFSFRHARNDGWWFKTETKHCRRFRATHTRTHKGPTLKCYSWYSKYPNQRASRYSWHPQIQWNKFFLQKNHQEELIFGNTRRTKERARYP